MPRRTNPEYLKNEQYRDARNLNARIQLHQRYSTNPENWFRWVFDQLDLSRVVDILELGCGSGLLWKHNLDRIPSFFHIYLSDFSPGMLRDTSQNIHPAYPRFNILAVDAQAISFPPASFDLVIANHMLYHVPDRPLALKEINRVLKPGRKLLVATNGKFHMAELHNLYLRLDPSFAAHSDYAFGISEFTIENGSAQLDQWFSNIQIRNFPGSLEVTEAEPLLAYILSMVTAANKNITRQDMNALRRIIDQEISMTGSFHITKSTSLFIAEKTLHS